MTTEESRPADPLAESATWDPTDPDCVKVLYDLSDWTIDQQAEVSAMLAELAVPHAWEGFEVAVPPEFEERVDDAFEVLERRLGRQGPQGVSELGDEDPAVEYDLADWTPAQRSTLVRAVADAGIPHRVEGELLVVAADAEDVVDELLDAVESGDVMLLDEDDGSEPVVSMAEVFTLADRLMREPGDERGRALLVTAADLDPERPPFGVALGTWRSIVAGIAEIAEALDAADEIGVVDGAQRLRGLVRPFV